MKTISFTKNYTLNGESVIPVGMDGETTVVVRTKCGYCPVDIEDLIESRPEPREWDACIATGQNQTFPEGYLIGQFRPGENMKPGPGDAWRHGRVREIPPTVAEKLLAQSPASPSPLPTRGQETGDAGRSYPPPESEWPEKPDPGEGMVWERMPKEGSYNGDKHIVGGKDGWMVLHGISGVWRNSTVFRAAPAPAQPAPEFPPVGARLRFTKSWCAWKAGQEITFRGLNEELSGHFCAGHPTGGGSKGFPVELIEEGTLELLPPLSDPASDPEESRAKAALEADKIELFDKRIAIQDAATMIDEWRDRARKASDKALDWEEKANALKRRLIEAQGRIGYLETAYNELRDANQPTAAESPDISAARAALEDGWLWYGRGPLKVANHDNNRDVASWEDNRWSVENYLGTFKDHIYALRSGSEIAWKNGLEEPPLDSYEPSPEWRELGDKEKVEKEDDITHNGTSWLSASVCEDFWGKSVKSYRRQYVHFRARRRIGTERGLLRAFKGNECLPDETYVRESDYLTALKQAGKG